MRLDDHAVALWDRIKARAGAGRVEPRELRLVGEITTMADIELSDTLTAIALLDMWLAGRLGVAHRFESRRARGRGCRGGHDGGGDR
jgi:hypothetical protein